jgi:hypothetical protein
MAAEGMAAEGMLAEGTLAQGTLAQGMLAQGMLAPGMLAPALPFTGGSCQRGPKDRLGIGGLPLCLPHREAILLPPAAAYRRSTGEVVRGVRRQPKLTSGRRSGWATGISKRPFARQI